MHLIARGWILVIDHFFLPKLSPSKVKPLNYVFSFWEAVAMPVSRVSLGFSLVKILSMFLVSTSLVT